MLGNYQLELDKKELKDRPGYSKNKDDSDDEQSIDSRLCCPPTRPKITGRSGLGQEGLAAKLHSKRC